MLACSNAVGFDQKRLDTVEKLGFCDLIQVKRNLLDLSLRLTQIRTAFAKT